MIGVKHLTSWSVLRALFYNMAAHGGIGRVDVAEKDGISRQVYDCPLCHVLVVFISFRKMTKLSMARWPDYF